MTGGESRQDKLWKCLPLGLISSSEMLVRAGLHIRLSLPCPYLFPLSPLFQSHGPLGSIMHGPASVPLHRLFFSLPRMLYPHGFLLRLFCSNITFSGRPSRPSFLKLQSPLPYSLSLFLPYFSLLPDLMKQINKIYWYLPPPSATLKELRFRMRWQS